MNSKPPTTFIHIVQQPTSHNHIFLCVLQKNCTRIVFFHSVATLYLELARANVRLFIRKYNSYALKSLLNLQKYLFLNNILLFFYKYTEI